MKTIDRLVAISVAGVVTGLIVLGISIGAEPIAKWWFSLSRHEQIMYQGICSLVSMASIVVAVRRSRNSEDEAE